MHEVSKQRIYKEETRLTSHKPNITFHSLLNALVVIHNNAYRRSVSLVVRVGTFCGRRHNIGVSASYFV